MPFASQQNMLDRFGEREIIALTDRDNTGGIDVAVLANALAAADSEINAYLAERYDLPFASVPVIVRDFSCDVARYRLCGGEVTETEEVRNRYKDAIGFFMRVSKGEITLGLNLLNQAQATGGTVTRKANNRVFSGASLNDY